MFLRSRQAREAEDAAPPAAVQDAGPTDESGENDFEFAHAIVQPAVAERISKPVAARMPRRELAAEVKAIVTEFQDNGTINLNRLETRHLITMLINGVLDEPAQDSPAPPPPVDAAQAIAVKPSEDVQAVEAESEAPADTPAPPAAESPEAPFAEAPPAEAAETPIADQPPAEPVPPMADTASPPIFDEQPVEPTGATEPPAEPPANLTVVPSDSGEAQADAGAPGESAAAEENVLVTESDLDIRAEIADVFNLPTDADGQPTENWRDDKVHELSLIEQTKQQVQPILLERIDVAVALQMPRPELARQITEIVAEILFEQRVRLNLAEQRDLVTMLINDMLGLGPLEPLLADETVTDIMVNGAKQVYVERGGKLQLTDVHFRNDEHVMNVATRIVTQVGRRVDESSPLVDARLADGSRVNIIIPPLAIDGPSISIRKFSKKSITLDIMGKQKNISENMATVLKIAGRSRLNVLISGGTGSGKTTLLNAMSQLIDHGERIVTIEDAAELQLQQPHVVRLETRPANLEGDGEINMRDLVKNALRMRPDRIILGEVRGHEAIDMLQAMNTGHEGSMCTIHANRPREALTRLENMVGMAGINLPSKAVRTQIAAAIDIIVQISRMRDGMRRVIAITEVTGMEGDVIITQDLFNFDFEGVDKDGNLSGTFKSTGLRPHFAEKAEYFGLHRTLLEAI